MSGSAYKVPMTAILKICLEHMDHPFATAFAYLMHGKPFNHR